MKEFFNNKTVAIVGPADYIALLDDSNIKKIENSDVIVRINCGFNIVDNYSKIVGSRTDIFYNNLLEDCINGGILDVDKISKSEIKHIRTIPKSDMSGISTSNTTNIKQPTLDKLINLRNNRGIHTSLVDCTDFTAISRSIQCRPTTGFVALLDIIKHNPKELYVTGFSFYLGGVLKGYFGGSLPGGIVETVGRTEHEESERNFNSKRHVHRNMWRVFKQEIMPRENVSVDPIMEKILALENYDREKYNEIIRNYQ